MRFAAIACAAILGLTASFASACTYESAKSSDVFAEATGSAPPAQSTPVRLPETDEKG